ncbi:MAG: hypothetical protein B7Y39_12930 [Bdellovibrio sp. 28-41-41]|nr:MAG: hypothetical protein B7Y39_12930 [Bdellovibrio sp. 28-41-41]
MKKTAKKVDKKTVKKSSSTPTSNPKAVDARIKELNDWRGGTLSQMRSLIKQTVPEVTEDVKWGNVPVWYCDGIICTGESYKSVVKLTFANGAKLKDPTKIFNSSLEGNTRRAIDIKEGEKVNEAAFKALINAAVALNRSK